jgi:hypothetical protein
MLVVTESDAAAIRTAYDQGGELSAAIELAGCSLVASVGPRRST